MLGQYGDALKDNTNLKELHMANVKATDRVAKVQKLILIISENDSGCINMQLIMARWFKIFSKILVLPVLHKFQFT